MLAQVDDAHMQTNCYFFIRQPCGPKITHASILLSDGGRADLAGGAENICNTYTHRLVISLCKSRRTWSICCHGAKWVCVGHQHEGVGFVVLCGRWELELDIAVVWLFLFSTVSTSVPGKTKKNYAILMLLNPDYGFSCEQQGMGLDSVPGCVCVYFHWIHKI